MKLSPEALNNLKIAMQSGAYKHSSSKSVKVVVRHNMPVIINKLSKL